MSDAPEIDSLNAEASAAAADRDYAGAARALRQVLERQTEELGPSHPDLATTLNNLALMLEQAGDIADAGHCYRRAHAIAANALPPDDPLVRVSNDNLNAFYRARGRPGDLLGSGGSDPSQGLMDFPAAPGSAPVSPRPAPGPRPPSPEPARATPPRPEARPVTRTTPRKPIQKPSAPRPMAAARPPAPPPPPRPAPESGPGRVATFAVLAAAVVVAGIATFWRPTFDDAPPASAMEAANAEPSDAAPGTEPPSAPAESLSPETVAALSSPAVPESSAASPGDTAGSARASDRPTPAAEEKAPPEAARVEPNLPEPPARTPTAAGEPGVVESGVCGTLSRSGGVWRCERVANPVRVDAVYYYTRIASPRDIQVRHRWSRDGRVVRVSNLRIGANPTSGYRTFTRQTVGGMGAGEWQVDLLGPDDRVLDSQRFVVP